MEKIINYMLHEIEFAQASDIGIEFNLSKYYRVFDEHSNDNYTYGMKK